MYYVFVKKDVLYGYSGTGQALIEKDWVLCSSFHDEEWAQRFCDSLRKEGLEAMLIKGEILQLSMPGV